MNTSAAADRPPREAPAPAALVIGLDNITGLQTSRLLARRGVRVVGIAADGRHPAARTNTCSRLVVSPTEGEGLLETLDRLAGVERGAVLFPCTDGSVRTLAHAPERLLAFRSVLPAADVVDTLMDKQRFAALAASRGLPIPATREVTTIDEADRAAGELRFPCVVKPSVKTPAWEAAGAKVHRFEDAASWAAAAGELLALHPDLVIQEWLPGGDEQLYSCNCYVSPHGMPIITFVARKLRQWPPRLGTSSLGEAVQDTAIRELAMETISSVPFVGLGYVEIKRDPVTGADHLIEVNVGRPTGRSAIAEAGGVELLFTMYRDAIGASLPVDRQQYDRPVKWIHLVRDLRSALHYLRTGELTPLAWYRSLRGPKVYADLDRSDPIPFVADLLRGIRVVLGVPRRTRAGPDGSRWEAPVPQTPPVHEGAAR
jgi:D-aspartate ligase